MGYQDNKDVTAAGSLTVKRLCVKLQIKQIVLKQSGSYVQ